MYKNKQDEILIKKKQYCTAKRTSSLARDHASVGTAEVESDAAGGDEGWESSPRSSSSSSACVSFFSRTLPPLRSFERLF